MKNINWEIAILYWQWYLDVDLQNRCSSALEMLSGIGVVHFLVPSINFWPFKGLIFAVGSSKFPFYAGVNIIEICMSSYSRLNSIRAIGEYLRLVGDGIADVGFSVNEWVCSAIYIFLKMSECSLQYHWFIYPKRPYLFWNQFLILTSECSMLYSLWWPGCQITFRRLLARFFSRLSYHGASDSGSSRQYVFLLLIYDLTTRDVNNRICESWHGTLYLIGIMNRWTSLWW